MKKILSQFAIPNEVGEPQPLKIGFINDSFIVRAQKAGEKSYFLQRINHHIFTNVEGLMRNIQVVTDHIREKLTAAGETDIARKVLEVVRRMMASSITKRPKGLLARVCADRRHEFAGESDAGVGRTDRSGFRPFPMPVGRSAFRCLVRIHP